MKYFEAVIRTADVFADIVAGELIELGSTGVSIEGGAVYLESFGEGDFDYFADNLPEDETLVKGYFNSTDFITALSDRLEFLRQSAVFPCGELQLQVYERNDSEWANIWKQFYKPIITDKIAVVPAWDKEFATDKTAIFIDPGSAFGTGSHETTFMCLKEMQKHNLRGASLIDVGCGSGILGIAAAKLGADCVLTDLDDNAVIQARKNVALNGLDLPVLHGEFLAGKDATQFDFIVANLTAGLLIELLSKLQNSVKTGAVLIISGIINSRADEVSMAFVSAGFKLKESIREGEWSAFVFYG